MDFFHQESYAELLRRVTPQRSYVLVGLVFGGRSFPLKLSQ